MKRDMGSLRWAHQGSGSGSGRCDTLSVDDSQAGCCLSRRDAQNASSRQWGEQSARLFWKAMIARRSGFKMKKVAIY